MEKLNLIKYFHTTTKEGLSEQDNLYTKTNLKDYKVYKLNKKELTEYYIIACSVCFVLGMLFYNSFVISAALCLVTPLFQKKYAEYKCDKQRKELLENFKDSLYSISASVAAGRSMPKAIADAAEQAEMFENKIAAELKYIIDAYNSAHAKIEDLLSDLAKRSGIEEIKLFAASYRICKKSGGDLEGICLKSAYLLIERIDYQNEVASVLSEKKLDTILLMAMPLLILLFLNLCSYDYIALLYECLEGRIIMTISLLLMVLAALWSLKMMNLDL